MYTYELAVVLSPELLGPALDEFLARIEGWITKSGGEVVRRATWGKRKLAYAIRKQNEGHYFFFYINLPGEAVSEVERNLRLNEAVLRFLSLRIEAVPAEDPAVPSERVRVVDTDDDEPYGNRYRRNNNNNQDYDDDRDDE